MIDFHSHILPFMDDGSQNLEETEQMVYQGYQQGICQFIATPHFYASSESISCFLKKREKSLCMVKNHFFEKEWVPQMLAGAEVYYFPNMGSAEKLSSLCIEGTSILLLEMPFVQWTEEIYQDVKDIIDRQHLTVILAHIERYVELQKSDLIWNRILNLSLYVQINAGSFMKRKRRKFCLQLIKNKYPVVLGSDCHNIESRPPNLQAGREVIRSKLGEEILKDIDCLGMRILEDV